jgi:hypothetical protein
MPSVRLALAAILTTTLALAEPDPRSITAEDFLADSQAFVGRRVIITNCTISRANLLRAFCSDPRQFGAIYLDGETMDTLSRAKAVEHCAAPNPKPSCAALVAGSVYPYPDRPRIRGALIFWRSAEQAGKWAVSDRAEGRR